MHYYITRELRQITIHIFFRISIAFGGKPAYGVASNTYTANKYGDPIGFDENEIPAMIEEFANRFAEQCHVSVLDVVTVPIGEYLEERENGEADGYTHVLS